MELLDLFGDRLREVSTGLREWRGPSNAIRAARLIIGEWRDATPKQQPSIFVLNEIEKSSPWQE